jgi:hypothetical protein
MTRRAPWAKALRAPTTPKSDLENAFSLLCPERNKKSASHLYSQENGKIGHDLLVNFLRALQLRVIRPVENSANWSAKSCPFAIDSPASTEDLNVDERTSLNLEARRADTTRLADQRVFR